MHNFQRYYMWTVDGFRSPWKALRLPRAKKSFLAFLMFSITDFEVDKFDCHQTPRHFAAGVHGVLSNLQVFQRLGSFGDFHNEATDFMCTLL